MVYQRSSEDREVQLVIELALFLVSVQVSLDADRIWLSSWQVKDSGLPLWPRAAAMETDNGTS